jgi:hypothetical protein
MVRNRILETLVEVSHSRRKTATVPNTEEENTLIAYKYYG